jgi:hypothetical protein
LAIRGTKWRTQIRRQRSRSATGHWRRGRSPASVTSIRLRSETRRVRPRQKIAATERRDSVPRVSARHARLHALPPILESGMPTVLEDSRERARLASVLRSTQCRPRSGVGPGRQSVVVRDGGCR